MMFFKTLFFLFKNFDMWSSAILDTLIVQNLIFHNLQAEIEN